MFKGVRMCRAGAVGFRRRDQLSLCLQRTSCAEFGVRASGAALDSLPQ